MKIIYSRTLKSVMIMSFALLIAVACSKSGSSGDPWRFRTSIDMTNSTLAADNNNVTFFYSTDGGTTWVQYPVLHVGQKYKARVQDNALKSGKGQFLTSTTSNSTNAPYYTFDWSASNPKPDNAASESPEFTFAGVNDISVKVIDTHCAFSPTFYTGGWLGAEGTYEFDSAGVKIGGGAGSTDLSDFTQDPSDPNKIWMTNVFGDGTAQQAYMELTTSTTYWDQNITIPAQTTSEGLTYQGSGKYDMCRGTLSLNVTYSYVDSGIEYAYKWTYSFTLAPYCTYNASTWTGAWGGDETNSTCCGGTDANNITADSSVPNRFHMSNFWGDGVDAYFDLAPSTNYFDQNVTLPQQTTTEGGTIAAGTGTYDQCSGTFNMLCDYTFNGTTHYVWTYKFHR